MRMGVNIRKIVLFGLGVLVATSLSSCARYVSYEVSVDSICTPSAHQKKTYVLMNGNHDGNKSNLLFQEFAEYTDKVLNLKGFNKANSISDAEIAIKLSYGISDPQYREYVYYLPIFGQTGIASSTTNGTINTFGSSIYYNQKTSYTPSYGIIGYSPHVGMEVVFARHMMLSAFDLKKVWGTKKNKDDQKIWCTTANSVGHSEDLSEVFPVLLIASQNHIAENTSKKIHYSIRNDKKLLEKINAIK